MNTQQAEPIMMSVNGWILFWLCLSFVLDFWIVKGIIHLFF